jgi:hypothetical protein
VGVDECITADGVALLWVATAVVFPWLVVEPQELSTIAAQQKRAKNQQTRDLLDWILFALLNVFVPFSIFIFQTRSEEALKGEGAKHSPFRAWL